MSTHENDTARDAAFDAAVRSAHVASLDHVSPRVRAQLVQRRRAALAGDARGASHPLRAAWPIAAAAAIGALAIGLSVRAPAPAPATVAADRAHGCRDHVRHPRRKPRPVRVAGVRRRRHARME
jgi:hypothetical protein